MILTPSARLLLLGNAMLVAPALLCIWESATTFYLFVRVDLSEFGIQGWFEILWGALSFVWLGLNVCYFYGQWGMIPRTS